MKRNIISHQISQIKNKDKIQKKEVSKSHSSLIIKKERKSQMKDENYKKNPNMQSNQISLKSKYLRKIIEHNNFQSN